MPQVRHMAGLVWWWPQPGSLEQPTFLVSQPWRLDGQEPPVGGAGSSEASLLHWEAAVSSPVPCSPSVPVSSSCKGASRAGSGPSYLFISTNYLFKDPLSKHSLWLRQWGFGLGGKDFLGGVFGPTPLERSHPRGSRSAVGLIVSISDGDSRPGLGGGRWLALGHQGHSGPRWTEHSCPRLPGAVRWAVWTGDKCREGLAAQPRERAFPGPGSMGAGGPVC